MRGGISDSPMCMGRWSRRFWRNPSADIYQRRWGSIKKLPGLEVIACIMSEEQTPDPGATRDSIVWLAFFVEGGLVALSILAGWLLEQPPLSHFAFTPAAVGWGLLATAPLLGLFLLVSTWPIGPLRKIKTFTEDFLRPMMSTCTLI